MGRKKKEEDGFKEDVILVEERFCTTIRTEI